MVCVGGGGRAGGETGRGAGGETGRGGETRFGKTGRGAGGAVGETGRVGLAWERVGGPGENTGDRVYEREGGSLLSEELKELKELKEYDKESIVTSDIVGERVGP